MHSRNMLEDQNSSREAYVVNSVMAVLIVISVFVLCLQVRVEPTHRNYQSWS